MELKKEVEILGNALKLCMRIQVQGFEAKPAAEAIDYLRDMLASKEALLPKEPEVMEGDKQDGQAA